MQVPPAKLSDLFSILNTTDSSKLSLQIHIYMYIYIYECICRIDLETSVFTKKCQCDVHQSLKTTVKSEVFKPFYWTDKIPKNSSNVFSVWTGMNVIHVLYILLLSLLLTQGLRSANTDQSKLTWAQVFLYELFDFNYNLGVIWLQEVEQFSDIFTLCSPFHYCHLVASSGKGREVTSL